MKVSLFIIVLFLYAYTTWVQKEAREVISETTAREVQLLERLGSSEKARLLAESALAAAMNDLEKLQRASIASGADSAERISDRPSVHHSAGMSARNQGM